MLEDIYLYGSPEDNVVLMDGRTCFPITANVPMRCDTQYHPKR